MLRHKDVSFSLIHAAFLEIVDDLSEFPIESGLRRQTNRLLWQAEVGGKSNELHVFSLLEPLKRLQKLVSTWTDGENGKNIILDVTCLPERFFFPMLRWLLASPKVENLLLTCMSPEKYTEEDLAYNPQDWAHIHTFGSTASLPVPSIKKVIVGAGFLPFNLPDWLKKDYNGRDIQVSVLLPFPAAPKSVRRAWEFVRQIELDVNLRDERQLDRIDANDLSGCFDRINAITRNGTIPTAFAPYGPKAHSAAMCLHALRTNAEVFYTQPTFYHPEYTTGIKLKNGLPAGFSYAIRINGKSLY